MHFALVLALLIQEPAPTPVAQGRAITLPLLDLAAERSRVLIVDREPGSTWGMCRRCYWRTDARSWRSTLRHGRARSCQRIDGGST
jgi:hypothetical protein